ncbi:MAG: tetratricopeptide repeat protein, partial [Anaerolineales bacterium]
MESRLGDIERARQLFEQGTRANPTDAAVWQAWALMESRLGDIERARQLFEQGTRANPTDAAVWQAWALMESRLGNIERARRLFEQGTRANPSDAATWQAWALMELQLNSPNQALQILERGLRKVMDAEGRASLYCLQGSAYARLEKFREAEESFEQAIRLNPQEARNHYFFALQVLEPLGRRKEAIEHYQRALQLRPRPEDRRKIEKALSRLK